MIKGSNIFFSSLSSFSRKPFLSHSNFSSPRTLFIKPSTSYHKNELDQHLSVPRNSLQESLFPLRLLFLKERERKIRQGNSYVCSLLAQTAKEQKIPDCLIFLPIEIDIAIMYSDRFKKFVSYYPCVLLI